MAADMRVKWKVLLKDEDWEGVPAEPRAQEETALHLHSGGLSRAALHWGLPWAILLLVGLFFLTGWEAVEEQADSHLTFTPAPSADRLANHARGVSLTEHLRIQASGPDVAVTASVAEELEALYRDIFAALGLPPTHGEGAPDGRLFVSVKGVRAPVWDGARGWVSLPSPARLPVPAQTSRQELLRQVWVAALVAQSTREASEVYRIPPGWAPLLDGLHIWLLRDAGGPLAEGWNAAAQQLYSPQRGRPSAADIESLCRRYPFGELASIDLSILLGCGPAAGRAAHISPVTTHLSALYLPESYQSFSAQAYAIPGSMATGHKLAVALLLEYAVKVYGWNKLPDLLAALSEHNSWQTLIPAVFNISAAEFEAGWREWLAKEYGGVP